MAALALRPRLSALTGLRFVAAAHVVGYHYLRQAFSTAPAALQNVLAGGDAAVSLFFVLSGFILTYTYVEQAPRLGARAFWGARFARIYPVYLLAFLAIAPLVAISLLDQYRPVGALLKATTYGIPVLTM